MRVYISSHDKYLAFWLAQKLKDAGHEITADWIELPPPQDESARYARAKSNMESIDRSDVLVITAGPEVYTGGKFVEAGYALGKGKYVCLLGRYENILMHHPGISKFTDLDALRAFIANLKSC